MKKKDLIKHIPADYPEENSAKIIKTPGRRVLMLMLPGWEVIGREREDCVMHFVWKDGYLTYYPRSQEWTRQKYATLYFNAYISGGGFDEKSLAEIMTFTNSGYAHGAVETYESSIDFDKEEKALERKQKRIDESMKDTPNLPKGFRAKCLKMFADSKEAKINIKLFQPHKGGAIERIFKVESYMSAQKGGPVNITEICRSYQKEYGGVWSRWMYGTRYGAYGNRQHFWDTKNGSIVNILPFKIYVYDNLDSLDLSKGQKDVLRALSGKTDPSLVLSRLRQRPEIEYVVKKGLDRVAVDMVSYNRSMTYLKDLTKESIEKLVRYQGGQDAAELLSIAPKIKDEYLKDFCKIKDGSKARSIIGLAEEYNINHIYKLLMEAGGAKVSTISMYKDYLRMAQVRGNNPHDEIIYRNRRWLEWHDRYADEIGREKLKEQNKADNRKYKNISIDYKLNSALFSWEDEDYLIIVPKNAGEINEEGRKQHHCVGAQPQYKQKMCERESFIVFLRKKNEPQKPYYTIECNLQKVIQFYAAYDRQPDKEKVQKILGKWMKQVKKNKRELSKAAG